MTLFDPGTIVLIRFPFTDLTAAKQRPALVLSSNEQQRLERDVIVAAISGQRADRPGRYDYVVKAWVEAGLLRPSVVRCAKLATLERSVVRKPLGRLADTELESVRETLRRALGV